MWEENPKHKGNLQHLSTMVADGGSSGVGGREEGGVGDALNAELPELGRRTLARVTPGCEQYRHRCACACAASSPSHCLVWGSLLQKLIQKEHVLGPGVGACS